MVQQYCGIDMDATCRRGSCFINISKFSDRQLATILKTSVQSVNKWRHAHNLPDIDNMFILSRVFGVSLDWMIIPCDYRQKKFRSDARDRATQYSALLGVLSRGNKREEENLLLEMVDYTQDGINLSICH